jgi:hypothetical protein
MAGNRPDYRVDNQSIPDENQADKSVPVLCQTEPNELFYHAKIDEKNRFDDKQHPEYPGKRID